MFALLRGAMVFGFGVYAGIGVAVSVAGPAVFRSLDSRTAAGDVFAALLRGTTTVDVILGIALGILAALGLPRAVVGLRRNLQAAVVPVMLALIAYYTFVLAPAMREHRSHIGSFDNGDVTTHRAAFDELHARYVRLYSVNLFVCAAGAVLAVGLREGPPRAPKTPPPTRSV